MAVDLSELFYSRLPKLQELICIPSVYDKGSISDGMPYGKNVRAALDFMKDTALADGFEVREYDGHALAVCYPSKGSGLSQSEKRIDIACHLDVVEPGEGWKKDPFSGDVEGGRLWGRGAQDMKASAFLCYLALVAMKENAVLVSHDIRLVFGCDEERTMDDLLYYLEKDGQPDFAFTPDGKFPMAIGEKGALMWRLSGRYDGQVKYIRAGIQCNVISPYAEAALNGTVHAEELSAFAADRGIDLRISETAGDTILKVYGKAGHASLPEEGHSATSDLLLCLGHMGDDFCRKMADCFADPYGAGAGLTYPEHPGELTLNLGVFRMEDGRCYGEVDCRYPYGVSSSEATGRISANCPLDVSLDYDSAPTLQGESDPYIKSLLNAYVANTGDETGPFISGGVSYSKVIDRCVAFGPVFPDEENTCHKVDESISLASCAKALEIYYDAIVAVSNI